MSKKIQWWQPQVGLSEYDLIKDVLDSNFLNEGAVTEKFEKELAALLGVKHAIAVTSGTAALYLSLYALGIGPGDEVIVPDLTFIATANAVTMCGAKVILVDVEPDTLNINPLMMSQAITSKTKAIIPVHVTGRPANMPVIMRLAAENKLFVVEDAAEALLSCCQNKYLGTWGSLGCFSFSPNKMITTGQGGLIVTNEDELYTRLRQLKDQGRAVRGTGGDDLHPVVGFNFKFTNLQAAIGLGQFQMLQSRVWRLLEIYCLYRDNLSDIKGIKVLPFNLDSGEKPQWVDALTDRRDQLDAWLAENEMHCRRFWHPLHTQKPYCMPDEQFPKSTILSKEAIWLPSAFTLSDDDIMSVCKKIREFFNEH